jgi:glycosyltransferase involved in cell wall biosynthesis
MLMKKLTCAIIIPTYKRTDDLVRTLNSVVNQFFKPTEVLVIVGPNDLDSYTIAKGYNSLISNLSVVYADKASLVNALNIGINMASCDIVCLTDDDVELPEMWLARIKAYFENNLDVGVYGGPDKLQIFDNKYINTSVRAEKVGVFTLTGMVGNHHCGIIKSPAEVDVIKGVNLSFRKEALRGLVIDNYLESSGAEICSEIDICITIKRNGYKIIYDNNNFLKHFGSERVGDDKRTDLFTKSTYFRMRNMAYVYAKYRPFYEVLFFMLYDFFLGSRIQPGVLRCFKLVRNTGFKVFILPFSRLKPLIKGLYKGLQKRYDYCF